MNFPLLYFVICRNPMRDKTSLVFTGFFIRRGRHLMSGFPGIHCIFVPIGLIMGKRILTGEVSP